MLLVSPLITQIVVPCTISHITHPLRSLEYGSCKAPFGLRSGKILTICRVLSLGNQQIGTINTDPFCGGRFGSTIMGIDCMGEQISFCEYPDALESTLIRLSCLRPRTLPPNWFKKPNNTNNAVSTILHGHLPLSTVTSA